MLCLVTMCTLAMADPTPVKFGGLAATPPTTWTTEKPANRLRSHQFKLASMQDGVADAELIVMPESSANIDKEFPRWKATFNPPEGKTLDEIATTGKFTVGTATVHTLDVSGTWRYKERPFDPKSKEVLKTDYRVIWAVVVQKDEATHVRLSGPQAVVAARANELETWLKSIK
jgi:hypothetical protein